MHGVRERAIRWGRGLLPAFCFGAQRHPLVQRYLQAHPAAKGQRIGWGYKESGDWARSAGEGNYLLFEDAFIRSLKPGYEGGVYGISVDRKGAIFDARHGCELIDLIAAKGRTAELYPETLALLERVRTLGASKYNWSAPSEEAADYAPGVMLVDQSRGDASMAYGAVSPADFARMVADALAEYPNEIVYLRTHPDQQFRDKKSCFSPEVVAHERIVVLPADLSPQQCFRFCHTVYVGTSLLGLEALIHGCQVITYGWNFYAGWGLTEDRVNHAEHTVLPRPCEVTLPQLFEAAYIDYCHYYDPDTLEPTDLGAILDHIALQQQQWARFRGECHIVASDPWKERLFKLYLQGPQHRPHYYRQLAEVPPQVQAPYLWGQRIGGGVSHPPVRVEDGFLRSKGLGVAFNLPLSMVFDDLGLYFMPDQPSRLEQILNSASLTAEQEREAEALLELVREHNLTKYNFPRSPVTLPPDTAGRRTILVPGQVEGDASIQYGSPEVQTNEELLQRVRQANPEAYICFKPHPDLTARLRKGAPLSAGLAQHCDHVILEGDLIAWVKAVDEVHTMTSTVGFEALLQGDTAVTTYGMPFYAGWGLTTDAVSCDRRTRQLTLTELTHGALIQYPVYLNPNTGEYITALKAAHLLADPTYHTARPSLAWRLLLQLKQWRNRLFSSPRG